MPELPEVETTRRGIESKLLGQTITGVIVRESRLRVPVAEEMVQACVHQSITKISRRAKYLLIHLDKGHLIIHLGMSGCLRVVPVSTPAQKHDHIDMLLSNGYLLRYTDPRRFGSWQYTLAAWESHPLLSRLGPEPLEMGFNGDYLYQHCQNTRIAIKKRIMDNKVVVGVGNIYASESLFYAGIHPVKDSQRLSLQECDHLCEVIKRVLSKAIQAGGTTLKDFVSADGRPGYFQQQLAVYGRSNAPCPHCTTAIQSLTIAGRNTFFCSQCQT